ncbi:hypothetical protein [Phormidium sp. CCY1219]|uniref:hypothetical protein n=1 Tax=Phormidium sp. CCY1219 TaxID=2886104 RepID=UPI002D1F1F54|nr:hypothetical protein [Phormidium sp. CCY1219]MEB3827935.1 hypothetical protein [Phormidium sp. CCY1219]
MRLGDGKRGHIGGKGRSPSPIFLSEITDALARDRRHVRKRSQGVAIAIAAIPELAIHTRSIEKS